MLKNICVCLLLLTALSGLALAQYQATISVSSQGGVGVITAQSGDLTCIFSRLKHTDSVTAVCTFGQDQILNSAVTLGYGQSFTGYVSQPSNPNNIINWSLTHVGPANYSWFVSEPGGVSQNGSF